MKKAKWHSKKSPTQLERLYNSLLPKLRKVAHAYGYALGVHGSMRRDMDLIAVPWVWEAIEPFDLVDALSVAACGLHAAPLKIDSRNASQIWEKKPYGRRGIVIPIGYNAVIDISFVPFVGPQEP